MRTKQILSLLKKSLSRWSDDRANSMGAAIAYFSLFSMAPLLIIIISLSGLFLGKDAAEGKIYTQLSDFIGTKTEWQYLMKMTRRN